MCLFIILAARYWRLKTWPASLLASASVPTKILAAKNMASFVVGECFSSYEELDRRVKEYQKEKFVQLTHRDSRTLQTARKRVPNRVEGAKSALKYYTVHLACVFGGKRYASKATGQRSRQRYIHNDSKVSLVHVPGLSDNLPSHPPYLTSPRDDA